MFRLFLFFFTFIPLKTYFVSFKTLIQTGKIDKKFIRHDFLVCLESVLCAKTGMTLHWFQDGIETEVNAIKVLLTTHHKLMSDIRAILKSLAKVQCWVLYISV